MGPAGRPPVPPVPPVPAVAVPWSAGRASGRPGARSAGRPRPHRLPRWPQQLPLASSAPRHGLAGARNTAWMPRSRCSYDMA